MSVVTGANFANLSISQAGGLGVAPQTGTLAAALLSLRSSFPASGAGADQLALVHSRTYTFAASTPITLDLTALADVLGAAISFSAVRLLAWRVQSATAGYALTVGGAGSNEWDGFLTSGSKVVWQPSSAGNDGFGIVQAPGAGMPVTSTSRLLKLDPGSNAVGAVDLIIAGS